MRWRQGPHREEAAQPSWPWRPAPEELRPCWAWSTPPALTHRYIRSERSVILIDFCLSIISSNALILIGQTHTRNKVSGLLCALGGGSRR